PAPMDTDTATAPANDTANDAAPVFALIVDASLAVTLTLPASMPVAPSPSMNAATFVPIRFSVAAPAPLSPTPTVPTPTAADPATTIASIVCSEVALIASAPALMAVS